MQRLEAITIAADVTARRRDPVAVMQEFLTRIDTGNPKLNAIVRHDPQRALDDAQAVTTRLDAGETMPLAGVPIIVKDNIWVSGRNISQGSRLFADFTAPADAISVARVCAAGAVVIGIGNCPEFACKGQTNSPLHGASLHPMDVALTPGGSSGGNAAALAAGFAPLALGTDAGGSGRRPSAHTGTVGFKPSFGAIPYGPGFSEPFWGISVIAPMACTVADAALLFGAIAGPDTRDADSIQIEPRGSARPAKALKIAYSPRLGLDVPVDTEVAAAINAGVDALRRAGWTITRSDPVWPKGLLETALMPLQAAGLAALHGAAFKREPAMFDPDVAAQIERGLSLTGADVGHAFEASMTVRRTLAEFFTTTDLLLTPTAPCVAWSVNHLGPAQIGGVDVPPRGHAVFTPFFNHALSPAMSIPCGRGRSALPIGLQIAGRRGADYQVLAAALEAEAALAAFNGGSAA
jgi:aspartyl-tRNA(Asn)/glutamyl-tRNA(Gln) amidotransferase subunit A